MAYETPTQLLKNGEFTWAPQVAPEGPILVVVSLDEQRAYAYRNGVQIGASTISSGKKGHRTPTGVFHTFLKDADHHSSLCMAIYKSRRDRQFAWFATTGSLSNRVYRKTCSGCYTSCSP